MRITINYDSCWHNSFLDGSDQHPLPKNKKREFKATSKSEFKTEKPISKDTVLGILCRLIGEQRKLYKARASDDYYFKEIEHLIRFEPIPTDQTQETVMVINKSDSRPFQSNMVGVVKGNAGLFFSEVSPILWSVLYLDINALMTFIMDTKMFDGMGKSSSTDIVHRVREISKMGMLETKDRILTKQHEAIEKSNKKLIDLKEKLSSMSEVDKNKNSIIRNIENQNLKIIELEDELQAINNSEELKKFDCLLMSCVELLEKNFEDKEYIQNGTVLPIRLYAVSLYLQLERMKNEGLPIKELITKKGKIQGFSERGFNGIRDFLNPFSTGSGKKTIKTPVEITKTSGKIDINIDVDEEKAKQIKKDIDNAGVSSFYLGKKGLAYVSDIRL